MAIYTTELITDRDYNIPEGRLPLEYAVDQANKAKTHSENTEVHVTADEKASWNYTTQHGDIVYDLNKMFPDAGETTNGPTKLWKQFYAINRIRRYFYDIDVANGDTDPETGFTYSKKMMVPGIKIRHYRAALSGYIPDPFWATYSWVGGNIDWNWNPDTDGNTNEFDDFSNTTKWQFSVTEHQFDLHLDGETTDSSGNFTRHITDEEREKWNTAVAAQSGRRKVILYRYVNKRDVGASSYLYDLAEFPAAKMDPQIFIYDVEYTGSLVSYWYDRIGSPPAEVFTGFLVDAPADLADAYLDFTSFTSAIESLTENGTMITTRLS